MLVPGNALADGGIIAGAWPTYVPVRARRPRSPGLSPNRRLAEWVEAKVKGLSDDQRALLEVTAFGEVLGQAELRALTRHPVARSLQCKGLLTENYDGRRMTMALADPSQRNALRAGVSATRARVIAGSLADAVEATGARREDDALRIASWRLVSGDGQPETMLAGAEAAFEHNDYQLAEKLARTALQARFSFEAALLAARLAGLQGRTDQAERELARLAARAADDDERGIVALARLDNSVTWTGHDTSGILHQAAATISDPRWREELEARRLGLLLYTSGPRASAEGTAPLLRRDRGSSFVFASVTGAYSLCRLGQIDAAIDVTTRGYAARMTEPESLAGCGWWYVVIHCLALNQAGRWDEADEVAMDHHRTALAERSTETQAIFAVVPATAVGERGRLRTSVRQARQALALSEQLGRPLLTRFCHLHSAMALALAGRAHEAVDALAALDALDLSPVLHDEVDLIQARAWTAAAANHLGEARRLLEDAAQLGEKIGDRVGQVAALHALARLGCAKQVIELLADVAARIDGELAAARVSHTAALADRDASRLETAAARFEAIGADLLAAEAAADASVAWRHGQSSQRAVTAQRRAEALAERCEGAHTPALQAIDIRGQLTPAQWETALMAATGHPNQQIADELCLSRRTVENRLQRSYDTLGISNRGELARTLGAPGCHIREMSA